MDRLVNLVSGFCDELMSLEQSERAPGAIEAAAILLEYAAVERQRCGDLQAATEVFAYLRLLDRMVGPIHGQTDLRLVP